MRLEAILILASLLLACNACGHAVIVWAEVDNARVRVEGYLSNGSPLRQGKVIVTDEDGNQLVQGALDERGRYDFETPALPLINIRITVDGSHYGEFTLKLESG